MVDRPVPMQTLAYRDLRFVRGRFKNARLGEKLDGIKTHFQGKDAWWQNAGEAAHEFALVPSWIQFLMTYHAGFGVLYILGILVLLVTVPALTERPLVFHASAGRIELLAFQHGFDAGTGSKVLHRELVQVSNVSPAVDFLGEISDRDAV